MYFQIAHEFVFKEMYLIILASTVGLGLLSWFYVSLRGHEEFLESIHKPPPEKHEIVDPIPRPTESQQYAVWDNNSIPAGP